MEAAIPLALSEFGTMGKNTWTTPPAGEHQHMSKADDMSLSSMVDNMVMMTGMCVVY